MWAPANSSPGQVASCSPGSWVPLFLQRQESKMAAARHPTADTGQTLLYLVTGALNLVPWACPPKPR